MINNEPDFTKLLTTLLAEDGTDITSMATFGEMGSTMLKGKMQLIVKEDCVIAGVNAIQQLIHSKEFLTNTISFNILITDCNNAHKGDIVFIIEGPVLILLRIERIILNLIQRMCGIATKTKKYVNLCKPYDVQVCDTRKTVPGLRYFDKLAVKLGGGTNHRMSLQDMFMIKDNHVDFCGSINTAIIKVHDFKMDHSDFKNTPVAIEVRNINELSQVLSNGNVDRIMLDNLDIKTTVIAVKMIREHGTIKIESTGGINLDNIKQYAECGVDFISVGDLTHHVNSIDLSLKFIK